MIAEPPEQIDAPRVLDADASTGDMMIAALAGGRRKAALPPLHSCKQFYSKFMKPRLHFVAHPIKQH
ncbi:MAG: hypothetical protein ACJAVR_002457 [Paracoccaceae bacterium]